MFNEFPFGFYDAESNYEHGIDVKHIHHAIQPTQIRTLMVDSFIWLSIKFVEVAMKYKWHINTEISINVQSINFSMNLNNINYEMC